jgi:LysR family nitrogen assimilation transcriptional regulator
MGARRGRRQKRHPMELRQIEYFLSVLEHQSFTNASAVLGVAQPALSRQIRQLEEELGVQLLYRHGRGVKPTEEGIQFQASVEPLLRELGQIRNDLQASSKMPAGEISIGMPPSISSTIAASLVESFRERHPQVRLHIVDGFSGFVNEWLVAGRIDMAVINQARRSPLVRADCLLSMDLFALGVDVDREHRAEELPLQALANRPLVLPTRNHGLRRELDAAAEKLGFELTVIAEIDALTALKELVRRGLGATVLPHGALFPEALQSPFSARRIVEPELSMEFSIAFSLQRPMTLGMRELARAIKAEVRSAIEDQRLVGRLHA